MFYGVNLIKGLCPGGASAAGRTRLLIAARGGTIAGLLKFVLLLPLLLIWLKTGAAT
jgi:hypothetical protein